MTQRQGGDKANKPDHKDIWKASVHGAYSLVLLFQHFHGNDSVCVVSRVNWLPGGKALHWVERHAASIGILPSQIYLVNAVEEKMDITHTVRGTIVVDDRRDALRAQARGAWRRGGA